MLRGLSHKDLRYVMQDAQEGECRVESTSMLALEQEFDGETSLEDFGASLWGVCPVCHRILERRRRSLAWECAEVQDFLPQASSSVADESIAEGTLPDEPGQPVVSRPLA